MKIDGPRTRSRKMWDRHGSWLILVVVCGFAFNGGMEWQGYKDQKIVVSIVESGKTERDQLRARLKEVNMRNQDLAQQLGPAVQQAEQAARRSGEAVEKADLTLKKANDIIEANK